MEQIKYGNGLFGGSQRKPDITGVRSPLSRTPLCFCADGLFGCWIVWFFFLCFKSNNRRTPWHKSTEISGHRGSWPRYSIGPFVEMHSTSKSHRRKHNQKHEDECTNEGSHHCSADTLAEVVELLTNGQPICVGIPVVCQVHDRSRRRSSWCGYRYHHLYFSRIVVVSIVFFITQAFGPASLPHRYIGKFSCVFFFP